MTRTEITQALDDEILRLQHVKQLLQGTRELTPTLARMVRQQPVKRRRVMSDEGRRRIVEAQKRRWAKVKGL
jgi:hypothetical protein